MSEALATYRPDLSDTVATYDEYGTGSVSGPEYYAGGEWSMRHVFEHRDGTYTVVTEYSAVIDVADLYNHDVAERPYAVQGVVEMIDCTDYTDPGGTETNADYHYGEGSYLAYASVSEAEVENKRYGANMSHEYFDIPDFAA